MAVVFKSALGSNFNNTTGTTLVITTTAAIAVGDLVIVRVASDNTNATTPAISCADSGGNTYTRHAGGAVNSTAAAGVAGAILATRATIAVASGGTITATFTTSIVGKAMYAESFTGALNTIRSTTVINNGTTAAAATVTTGNVNLGDLVVGIIANETRTAITPDSDTLNGSWSTQASVAGGGTSGQDATSVTIAGQYKIVNAAGAQTYNVVGAATEYWAAAVVLQVVPDPTVTQAAYRIYDDGTETASTALAVQSTALTVDVTAGDVNIQLRTRLQLTGTTAADLADDWQLQWEKNSSGSWNNVVSTGTETLLITYPDTNAETIRAIGGSSAVVKRAQSFLGDGQLLTKAGWYLSKSGSPTGNVTMEVFAHTATFGSDGLPTGSALATATPINITTLALTNAWYEFTFPTPITLTNGTPYVIAVGYNGFSAGNNLNAWSDSTSPTDPGSGASSTGGGVWATSVDDHIYRIYTAIPATTAVAYASANLTDAAATTSRLTGGTGTFVAGKISETGEVTNLGWAAPNQTELLYSITLKQADLVNADTLRFRILRNGATTGFTYTQYPTINITSSVVAEAPAIVPIMATRIPS